MCVNIAVNATSMRPVKKRKNHNLSVNQTILEAKWQNTHEYLHIHYFLRLSEHSHSAQALPRDSTHQRAADSVP